MLHLAWARLCELGLLDGMMRLQFDTSGNRMWRARTNYYWQMQGRDGKSRGLNVRVPSA